MRIRHLVAADNVEASGEVRDPTQVRHGLVVGGRIAALAGPIDPLTHLNADFTSHRVDLCLVVEALAPGAAVCRRADGRLRQALLARGASRPLGPVDEDERRLRWQEAFAARRRRDHPA